MDTQLQAAIEAIQAEDKHRGRRLLIEVLKAEPDNELAWLWMAKVVEGERRQQALERVLEINPLNALARQTLERMERQPQGADTVVAPVSSTQALDIDDTKTCPYCAEIIRRQATVCRYCGRELVNGTGSEQAEGSDVKDVAKSCLGVATGIITAPFLFIILLVIATALCCSALSILSDLSSSSTNALGLDVLPLATQTRNMPPTYTPRVERASSTRFPANQIINVTGTENMFERVTFEASGRYYFASGHFDSPGLFNARLKDDYGSTVAIIASCANECEDKRFVNVEAGTYFLDVAATGDWAIVTVSP